MRAENTEEKIDVHRAKESYRAALANLTNDSSIGAANKQHILDYLTACTLGKTVFGRQKKKIKEKRLLKYLYTLCRISEWLGNKDFRQITQQEMERFIASVEDNRLTRYRDGVLHQLSYAEWSRRDIKVTLKKFYKWLIGDGRQYPGLVSWIDTSIDKKAPPSLSLEEIKKCVDYATSIRGKALCWTLFETGARAEEFLNIRLKHVEAKNTHFVVWIEYPKTFRRSLPIFEGANYLREWLHIHPKRNEPNAQLFPISYEALLNFLKRLGVKALKKRVTPQLMRDSVATWLASKKVGRYQMCKLMGWSMSSEMPDRYIDRLGVVEEEAIQSIRGDALTEVERENSELKLAVRRLETQSNELMDRLSRREEIDNFLTALLKDDDEVGGLLVTKIKQKKLEQRLLKLG